MGWRERDYSQDTWTERRTPQMRFYWPARTAAVLIGVHIAAFALVVLVQSASDAERLAPLLVFAGPAAHPLGILLHPLLARDVLTLILTVLILWTLGTRIEQQIGWRRMLGLYVLGNVLAGTAFFALARLVPSVAGLALDYPAGALAAWGVAAYRGVAGEMVVIFGRVRNLSHVVGMALAIAVGLMLAIHRLAAIGWLAALVAGGVAEPLVRRLVVVDALRVLAPRRKVVRPSILVEPPRDEAVTVEGDVDEILAKISRSGLGSLTPVERSRLEAAREAKLRAAEQTRAGG